MKFSSAAVAALIVLAGSSNNSSSSGSSSTTMAFVMIPSTSTTISTTRWSKSQTTTTTTRIVSTTTTTSSGSTRTALHSIQRLSGVLGKEDVVVDKNDDEAKRNQGSTFPGNSNSRSVASSSSWGGHTMDGTVPSSTATTNPVLYSNSNNNNKKEKSTRLYTVEDAASGRYKGMNNSLRNTEQTLHQFTTSTTATLKEMNPFITSRKLKLAHHHHPPTSTTQPTSFTSLVDSSTTDFHDKYHNNNSKKKDNDYNHNDVVTITEMQDTIFHTTGIQKQQQQPGRHRDGWNTTKNSTQYSFRPAKTDTPISAALPVVDTPAGQRSSVLPTTPTANRRIQRFGEDDHPNTHNHHSSSSSFEKKKQPPLFRTPNNNDPFDGSNNRVMKEAAAGIGTWRMRNVNNVDAHVSSSSSSTSTTTVSSSSSSKRHYFNNEKYSSLLPPDDFLTVTISITTITTTLMIQ